MSKIFAQDTDCSFLIEQAVKAPSGHNTQPWTFRIKETGIDILPDFTKTLPVVDPDNRELFISLGCATENLCVAAAHKGYETMVSIAENGTIHIELTKQDSDTPSPLFPHISVRQTNRSVYDGNTIPVNDIVALGERYGTLCRSPFLQEWHTGVRRYFGNGLRGQQHTNARQKVQRRIAAMDAL